MEEKEIQKPLILEIDEAKREIIQSINNAIEVRKLPFYIIEMILSDLHTQIKGTAKDELEMARARMEQTEVAE